MKTLVYVGANKGNVLVTLFREFDLVYAFEPDPELYSGLVDLFSIEPQVHIVNAACSLEDGYHDLFVYSNRVSTSLSSISDQYPEHKPIDIVKVKTINLGNFLKQNNVDFIDLYVSDCQGSDFTVMKTLKDYIDSKRIKEICVETHADGTELYTGLYNGKSGFDELLSDSYELCFISLDGKIAQPNHIPNDALEWDSIWRVKGDHV
jgi:FkbM family methyltransferase